MRDNNPLQYGRQPANEGRVQVFEEDGIFIVPQGVEEVYISGCAAGGGGGGTYKEANGSAIASSGASGASVIKLRIAIAPGMAIPIKIGKKGIGGGPAANGTDGGLTSFGTLLILPGGLGGLGQNGVGSQTGNRSSLSGVVKGVLAPMWDRADPYSGNTPFGEGNLIPVCALGEVKNGNAAIGPGGAGTGACASTNLTTPVSSNGANGADGILIVEW